MSQKIINKKCVKVRHQTLNDVENVLQLGKTINWQLANCENQVMIRVDPEGLFVAEDEETG
jgi:hypothetical protein